MKEIKELFVYAQMLGLQKSDIKEILNRRIDISESSNSSLGPPLYPGTHYGTVSIKSFKIVDKKK